MSARSRLNRVLDSYSKNPVKDVEAHLIQGGDEDGIHFEHHVSKGLSRINKYYVNVYSDGSISVPMVESDLETLKVDDPVLYDLVMVISNDLRILELREKNTKSYVFDNSYDTQAVEEALTAWKESTRCFVCLNEGQKAALYNGLLCYQKDLSVEMIKQWFYDHDIPFIPTGSVTITVDAEQEEIRFVSNINVSERQSHEQKFFRKMNAEDRCDNQIRGVARRFLETFGISWEEA